MNTWIFQSNPSRFDIDGYLATRPAITTWLVTRYADQITAGDRVFVWQSNPNNTAEAGILAEAYVSEAPREREDLPSSKLFWTSAVDAGAHDTRALIRFVRIASKRERLLRKWLRDDPILKDLPILRMASGPNFPVPEAMSPRLDQLWAKIGTDWTWDEAVAALLLYHQTYGQGLSRTPTSSTGETALVVGRVVTGVYNKVLNFRALDPRDHRAGLSSTSAMDRRVWDVFFDPIAGQMREKELVAEFERLWGAAAGSLDITAAIDGAEKEARKLHTLTLEELFDRYRRGLDARSAKPKARAAATKTYERDPTVVAIAKVRARFNCEAPNCVHPQFIDEDGYQYCEAHHIIPLAAGGTDTVENVACLCPAHHREAHVGKAANELTEALMLLRTAAHDSPAA